MFQDNPTTLVTCIEYTATLVMSVEMFQDNPTTLVTCIEYTATLVMSVEMFQDYLVLIAQLEHQQRLVSLVNVF